MSGPVLRIDSTHSSLDCYIGSILLALSSIRADRRGTYQPTPDRGRPSVPTLQPPPHTVRPRMRLQANFLRPLRLFVPSIHAACTSWLLSTFQHHVRPRLGPSIQSLYSIGSQLDYFLSLSLFSLAQQESTNHKLHPLLSWWLLPSRVQQPSSLPLDLDLPAHSTSHC